MGNKSKSQEFRAGLREDRAKQAIWEIELLESLKALHRPLSGEERYYAYDDAYTPRPNVTLYDHIENVLREKPLGDGKTSNAYALHGAFEGYVLNINRKEMDNRLNNTTMLYPVKISAQDVGAPVLMNESGSIQIQPLMPGKSLQKTYEDLRGHYRLKYAHYQSSPYYASTRAYLEYLQSLIAIPDEIYVDYFKSIARAALDGLAPDLHGNNVFLENLSGKTHLRALDFHHYDSKKVQVHGSDIRFPDTQTIMGGFKLEDDKHRMITPRVEATYSALKEKIDHALTIAEHDPEIRHILNDQPLKAGFITPQLRPESWLDKEHGRALKDIKNISGAER